TSPDPISGGIGNPQSLNKYAYVLNNPNKFVDPDGRETKEGKKLVYVADNSRDLENEIDNAKITAQDYYGEDAPIKIVGVEVNSIGEMAENAKRISQEEEGLIDLLIVKVHGQEGYQRWSDSEGREAIFNYGQRKGEVLLKEMGKTLSQDAVCLLRTCFGGSASWEGLGNEVARGYTEQFGRVVYGTVGASLILPPVRYNDKEGFMSSKYDSNADFFFKVLPNQLMYIFGFKDFKLTMGTYTPMKRFDPSKKKEEDRAQTPE
ncbi:hypothetical protein HYT23_06545, partial [Candidatus Pacearchaeota archaeon]|nr:hypothetical protein [Candidatus Pacearchaeota archaeon]